MTSSPLTATKGDSMKQPKFRRAALALMVGLGLATGAVQAQDKAINLKFSSWVPGQHALNPSLKDWGKASRPPRAVR